MPARRTPSMAGPMTFRFLNETRHVIDGSSAFRAPSQLWLYHLHYFDDLNASGAQSRRAWHVEAIQKWIRAYPPGSGEAWAPYPTSLRAVNWIKWALGGVALEPPAIQSLAMQIRVLRRRLEYHLLGNHLFVNAKALVYAGLFFDGTEAQEWLNKGMAILAQQMPEQILSDGGQFERSPMYHALALEDMLDLINVSAAFRNGVPEKWSSFVNSWPAVAERMRAWLSAMCHPDGEIGFFNDAAIGIAPSPAELERYAVELLGRRVEDMGGGVSLRASHFAQSGYVRADVNDAALLLDVAPIGPDYLPGHAHADTLSFELSLFGQRVVVNGGTSRYGLGPERDAERGTAAHSTVTVDDQNSSEVWAGFRVARRARPFDLAIDRQEASLRVSCAHDGYRRLPGKPVHRRTWTLQPGDLRIQDQIEGRFGSAIARFHLHPMIKVTLEQSGNAGRLWLPADREVRWRSAGGSARLEPSYYAPEFGRREPTKCLALQFDSENRVSMQFEW